MGLTTMELRNRKTVNGEAGKAGASNGPASTPGSASLATSSKSTAAGAGANGHSKDVSGEDAKLQRVDRGRARSGFEIPRKLLHSSIAPIIVWLYLQHPDVTTTIKYASLGLGVIASADLLRFSSSKFEAVYEGVLRWFMREEERSQVNGVIYYLVGVVIVLTFLPRDIASLSIIILSWCDTSASVFGRLFGRYTPRLPLSGTVFADRKSVAGSLAAVVTGCIQAYIWWSHFASQGDEHDVSWVPARLASTWTGPPSPQPTFLPRLANPDSTLTLPALTLACGLTAGFAEAIDLFGLDDNLTLPVLFGFSLYAILRVLG